MSDRNDRGPEQPAAPPTPVPVANLDNAGFWEGCRAGELRAQRCDGCGTLRHPPRPMCPQCGDVAYQWARLSGRGVIYTFTIVHRPTLPAFDDRVPYNVVVVQLEEGLFVVSNLVGGAPDTIRIGLPVEVVFEAVGDEASLPRFRARR
jgi:uncharacterized OB-fold protein